MRITIFSLAILLAARPVFAGVEIGIVVAVDKNGFTIEPEPPRQGKKVTMLFGPDMGKKGVTVHCSASSAGAGSPLR